MSIVTPSDYGLLSYGQVSYGAYFILQPFIPSTKPTPTIEMLVTALIPAPAKPYFIIQE